MSEITAIYYSANREDPVFAANVVKAMLEAKGDAEVVSVTQKPMDLGHNIVVTDVGWSGYNSVRQLRLGILAAKTPYVCNVESDTLYPPDYYSFRPPQNDTLYHPRPTWLAFAQKGTRKYYSLKRHGFEGATVAHRDAMLKAIDEWCEGMPDWIPSDADHDKIVYSTPQPLHTKRRKPYHWGRKSERFDVSYPVLTVKTSQNLHARSMHLKETNTKVLEPFGEVHEFLGRMYS